MQTRLIVLLVLVICVAAVAPVASQETTAIRHATATVQTHPSQGDIREVEGAEAELFATEDGMTLSFRTNALEANHVYTAWWVVINRPENCTDSPCASSDFLTNIDAVQTEVTYADGILFSAEGRAEFAAFLPAGEVPEAWYSNGLTNPMGAEVHVVIQDHGPLLADSANTMINTLRGGCTDESVPAPYPDIAKADGAVGPNTCRLVQFAIFEPDSRS